MIKKWCEMCEGTGYIEIPDYDWNESPIEPMVIECLDEMKFMISNPNEIVSSRYDTDKVLRSVGIDTVGKTIEEKYIELKSIVNLTSTNR